MGDLISFNEQMDDTREMIEGCMRGEKRWQDRLYKKYSSLLYGICLRYTKNRMEAQDVVQETFVKIYKNIHTFTEGHSFEGWVRRIAINTSITQYRKNQRIGYSEDLDEVVLRRDEPTEFEDLEFTREEMLHCINQLPTGYRTVFNLYVVEGFMHKEIADMLGIDVNTSKSQLSRAKSHLQKELLNYSQIKSIAE